VPGSPKPTYQTTKCGKMIYEVRISEVSQPTKHTLRSGPFSFSPLVHAGAYIYGSLALVVGPYCGPRGANPVAGPAHFRRFSPFSFLFFFVSPCFVSFFCFLSFYFLLFKSDNCSGLIKVQFF
jgi:hypothetical protein